MVQCQTLLIVEEFEGGTTGYLDAILPVQVSGGSTQGKRPELTAEQRGLRSFVGASRNVAIKTNVVLTRALGLHRQKGRRLAKTASADDAPWRAPAIDVSNRKSLRGLWRSLLERGRGGERGGRLREGR